MKHVLKMLQEYITSIHTKEREVCYENKNQILYKYSKWI
jgi:hypothetical protein